MPLKEYPDPIEFPKTLRQNRKVGNRLWLAGIGNRETSKIMFIAPSVLEEEVKEFHVMRGGRTMKADPRYLNHAAGNVFKDLAARYGVDINNCFFTSVVKFLPEKASHINTPSKDHLNACIDVLEADIEEVRPDLIIAIGKWVFDLVTQLDVKLKPGDISGAWFRSHKYHCLVYPMSPLTQLIKKPETAEKFKMEFKAIKRWIDATQGKHITPTPLKYQVVRNSAELRELVETWKAENRNILALDCEWHGRQFIDCKLRSAQFAWAPGEGVYIRFMDDKLNYTFDISYAEAGKILSEWLDLPDVKYIGHHVSADLAAIHHWLGLEWYNKTLMDTEFAEQCCDESAPRGLDDLALKYTDLGKYDIDLAMWKKRKGNKELCAEGYGYIPDDILIPYAIKDVDTCIRCYPILRDNLKSQLLEEYYYGLFNPFTTNVFTSFLINGLPVDIAQMDIQRDLYQYTNKELLKDFRVSITKESEDLLKARLETDYKEEGLAAYNSISDLSLQGETGEAFNVLKNLVGVGNIVNYQNVFDHYTTAPDFNIRSGPQMRRWLFDVKGYTPVKTTGNKENGMPSVSWEKVMEYPPDRQREFTPAADKETMRILGAQHSDPVIHLWLRLNAVGNICKSFLKESDIDEDTGDLIRENGIHYWVASDGKIHPMTSATETGRPRS